MSELDSAATLDELVAIVQSHLAAACVIVTRVTDEWQSVLAHVGRPLPDWFVTSAPLGFSICRHSAAMDFPLAIDDAFSHPLLRGNLAVSELSVAAYLGAPVHLPSGQAFGALCALEFHQRRWSEEDVCLVIAAARIGDRILAAGS